MSTPPGDQRQGSSTPPAPRGTTPTPPRPRRFAFGRNWILFLIGALLLNIFLGARAMREPSRVRVPYSPFFLQQVRDGKVEEITSKGTAIQGTFKEAEAYKDSKQTTRFRTEIPAFADNTSLSKLLQSKGVIVNAKPLDTGSPWWQSLCCSSGPRSSSSGCSSSSCAEQGTCRTSSARSGARGLADTSRRVTA